ncbi:Regulator of Vps4 activity in the MVB pathway protein [Heracleum sosnowskyi]|uniref:Regulator of Vps4 activity in the MVB pathway protein n=1 Tax=Heracleum sosnowskyi TaxID=360622 RepID=A0AAD8IHD8_9APIA|nr:Regulator of Vps4 activity in the MVB pathway protein [Heracleum sosnowskyi]
MVAAYELIEIYCELIAARLPIIESQKNCPIDLKEAIASVIFASPRCSDIPELTDVKKHFTAKYGKEFITAALELRPNSGVARMVVEKLSAVAPDVQTKSKVLNAIEEEHNIKWDSKSFEEKESEPAEDLLNGPSSFEKAGEMHAVSKIQVPNVQATSSYDKPVGQVNFSESNSRSSLNTPKYSSADPGVLNTNTGFNPDLRSSGSWAERMEYRQSFGRDDAYSDRKHWDIEFKDATSAAHAAAEAAERASMAARAAAELSTREDITRRYSTESQKLKRHDLEGYYAAGNGEDLNRYVQEEDRRPSQSSSRSYSKASIYDEKIVNNMQKPDRYSENVASKETTRAKKDVISPKNNLNNQSFEGGTKRASGRRDDFDTENVNQFGGSNMGRQHNSSSSLSRSSSDNEIYNALDHSNSKSAAAGDPYVENYQESVHNGVENIGSYNDYFTAFDEYELNDDNHKFDAGPKYDVGESKSFSESPAKSVNPTESERVPVTYSMDALKFDSEDELDNSTYDETNDSGIYSPKQKVFSQYPEPANVETQGSTGSLAFKEIREDDVHATGSSDALRLAIQNRMESENRLSYGALTGGFRNKGYMHPPYRKLSDDASSLPKEMAEKNSSRNSSHSQPSNTAKEKSSFSVLTTRSDSDADTDDSMDEVIQKASSIREAPQSQYSDIGSIIRIMPSIA